MSNSDRHILADRISITCDDGDLMQGFAQRFNVSLSDTSGEQGDAHPPSLSYDRRLELPDAMGSGWMQQLVLRPGLEVRMVDFSLKQPILMKSRHDPTLIELGFWQAGRNIRYRFDFADGVTQPNQASFSTIPMPYKAEALFPKDECVRGLSLSISPTILRDWLIDTQLPGNLNRPLLDNPSQIIVHQQPIPAILFQPLSQLQSAAWQGAMLRLYAEAKIMEIVALYVSNLNQQHSPFQTFLTQDDVNSLHKAKAILLSRVDDPPSLLELAQAVHINDHKLKVGFKAVFGTTVFGMLYNHRMMKAHELLEDRRFSITEVALRVGYRSPGAFSTAFRRKYGITPREVRH